MKEKRFDAWVLKDKDFGYLLPSCRGMKKSVIEYVVQNYPKWFKRNKVIKVKFVEVKNERV